MLTTPQRATQQKTAKRLRFRLIVVQSRKGKCYVAAPLLNFSIKRSSLSLYTRVVL